MKYSQFFQFIRILESQGLSLEEWKKNPEVILEEKEGDQEKDLGKDAEQEFGWTARGKAKARLNKRAKELQLKLFTDLTEKFIPKYIEGKKGIYEKLSQMEAQMGDKANVEEAINKMKGDIQKVERMQDQMSKTIETYVFKIIEAFTLKINQFIEKGFKLAGPFEPITQANLQAHWALLSSQITLNVLNFIQKKEMELIDEILKNPELIQKVKTQSKSVLQKKLEEEKLKTVEAGKKVKELEAKAAEEDKKKKAEKEAEKKGEGKKEEGKEAEKKEEGKKMGKPKKEEGKNDGGKPPSIQ